MHTQHLILVKANDWEEALNNAKAFLEHYGDSRVWDWYDIGGRWCWKEGNHDKHDSHQSLNVLKVSDNKVRAEKIIREKLKRQKNEIISYNKRIVEAMKKAKISCLNNINQDNERMTGYYLYSLGQLLAGYYCFDSGFYDVAYGSPYIDDERIGKILDGEGNDYYICNFDLHN